MEANNSGQMNLEMNVSIKADEDQELLIPIRENSELVIHIRKNLEPEPARECCIYRVPKRLRMVNKKAYTPHLVSIGPLHHGKKELTDMENRKTAYVQRFLERITIEQRKDVLTFVQNKEQRIRNCYSETSKLNSQKFVLMILYDAIFIIELFIRKYNRKWEGDFFLKRPKLHHDLERDMLLLENQLPYFVLEELYKLAFVNSDSDKPTFGHLCYVFFDDYMPEQPSEVLHFTDLRREALLKSYPFEAKWSRGIVENIPCAVKLHESGVKFKSSEAECLLDVRFEERKQRIPCFKVNELRIPPLQVVDRTESLFRNVMALEQCHYPREDWVCQYINLFDRLIETEKDVDLLVAEGIISNWMGDNASIAKMFNKLGDEIFLSGSYYDHIGQDLKAHYKKPWNHTKAMLKSVYFSNIWRGTATVAAVILLVLTVVQTICSILQVV